MPETHTPEYAAQYPRALLGVYIRTTLWYLGLVTLLWMVGFEAIHGHPTPFYALIAPIGFAWDQLLWAVGAGLVAVAMLIFLVRNFLPGVLGAVPQRDRGGAPLHIKIGGLSRRQLALLVVFAALFPAVVAMMRGGFDGISQAYSRQSYEYINDIGVGGSIRGLFHDYEKYHTLLSMHAKVHPPGPIAILWVLSYVAGRTPMGLSIATILFGALSVLPMYWLARDMLGEWRGRIAVLLYALMPTVVLFTATSADITFMPFTLVTLFLFWRSIHGESTGFAQKLSLPLVAGILYGWLGLVSFSLLSIGVFFALIGLWRLFDARYHVAVLRTALLMLFGAIGVHLFMHAWTGYDTLTVFELSKQQFDTDQINLDLMDPRWPAWAFKIVNPLCWFFFAGIPVSVLALRRVQSSFSRKNFLFLLIGLTLLAFDILYLARGEGERSAMYIMPFIVLPAAHMIDEICAAARSWRPLAITLACLGAQCIATEAILYTYW